MNVQHTATALGEIKISQLDDEFQLTILNIINPLFPADISISSETTGKEIKALIDSKVPREQRVTIMKAVVFSGDTVRRFYNEIEKCQQAAIRDNEYGDSVKSNFIAQSALLEIIVVVILMAIYSNTAEVRGEIPESRVGIVIGHILTGLSDVAKAEAGSEASH